MKQGNVLQTAGCTQSGSTFICKQHGAEGAATHKRSIIFQLSQLTVIQHCITQFVHTHTHTHTHTHIKQ